MPRNVTGLDLASTGFLDSSAGLGGIADLEANLSSKGGTKAKPKQRQTFPGAFSRWRSPAGVPVTVNFATKYNLRKNAGVLEPSTLNIGTAAAHLNGTYESAGEATVVNIKLDAKDMPAIRSRSLPSSSRYSSSERRLAGGRYAQHRSEYHRPQPTTKSPTERSPLQGKDCKL